MDIQHDVMNYRERMGAALCGLYRGYGYQPYKMCKFEEYDLYARNKDFLCSDAVLTFTDLGGKLMALKPDVTLSIVRNTRDEGAGVQKVYYTENVYRAVGGSFHEILQSGLECIGSIDVYQISEVLILAAESLRRISSRSVLVLSQMDILSALLDSLRAAEPCRRELLRCIAAKSVHELTAVCASAGLNPERTERLVRLLQTAGTPAEVFPMLDALGCGDSALKLLRNVCRNLEAVGLGDMLRIDFSVVSDMTYYNGIIFKGYVDGVPVSVLSGGQYDRLMRRMGRAAGAIGFAVYLDALERLKDLPPEYDTDLVLLYRDGDDLAALCTAVRELTDRGQRVTVAQALPEKLRYRQAARLKGSEVELIGTHA